MEKAELLVQDLKRLASQTGHMREACLGCGYEHDCSVHGCALIREGAGMIEKLNRFHETQLEHVLAKLGETEKALQASEEARADLGRRLAGSEQARQLAPEWIRVEDRLPERNDRVLVYYHFGSAPHMNFIAILDYYAYTEQPHFQDALSGELHVTHWMPLPEAPKGGAL